MVRATTVGRAQVLPVFNWVTLGKGPDHSGPPQFPLLDAKDIQGMSHMPIDPSPNKGPGRNRRPASAPFPAMAGAESQGEGRCLLKESTFPRRPGGKGVQEAPCAWAASVITPELSLPLPGGAQQGTAGGGQHVGPVMHPPPLHPHLCPKGVGGAGPLNPRRASQLDSAPPSTTTPTSPDAPQALGSVPDPAFWECHLTVYLGVGAVTW